MKFFICSIVMACGLCMNSIAYSETFVVTEARGEAAVTMAVGDTLNVILESNPSTGYSWNLVSPTSQWLVFADMKFTPSSAVAGAPGFGTYSFVAVSPGRCDIVMEYARVWEKEIPPVKTFAVSVCIESK